MPRNDTPERNLWSLKTDEKKSKFFITLNSFDFLSEDIDSLLRSIQPSYCHWTIIRSRENHKRLDYPGDWKHFYQHDATNSDKLKLGLKFKKIAWIRSRRHSSSTWVRSRHTLLRKWFWPRHIDIGKTPAGLA